MFSQHICKYCSLTDIYRIVSQIYNKSVIIKEEGRRLRTGTARYLCAGLCRRLSI